MSIPFLGRAVDERFLNHRLRSTSLAGIAGGVLASLMFSWRYYVDHVWSWDLLVVAVTIVGVKLGAMLWLRLTDLDWRAAKIKSKGVAHANWERCDEPESEDSSRLRLPLLIHCDGPAGVCSSAAGAWRKLVRGRARPDDGPRHRPQPLRAGRGAAEVSSRREPIAMRRTSTQFGNRRPNLPT